MHQVRVVWNLRLLQAIRFSTAAFVLFPVFVVFYQQKGLNQAQIFLIDSVLAIGAASVELPGGWFADRCGHKKSILLGCVIIATGFCMYYVGHGFASLLIAELCIGLGYGLRSGADSALAFESLKAIGDEEGEYQKFEANTQLYASVGGIAGSVAGGLIATWSLDVAVVLQAFIAICSIPLACGLKEAPRDRDHKSPVREKGKPLADIRKAVWYVFRGHTELKWIVWIHALVSVSIGVGYWLAQPYYQQAGIPIGWFGALGACYLGAIGLFALLFRRFKGGSSQLFLSAGVVLPMITFTLLCAGPSVWLVPAILGFCFITATAYPVMLEKINRAVEDSTIRATVLSVKALVTRLVVAVVGPVVGWIMDVYSLRTALLCSAVACTVTGIVILVGLRRVAKKMVTS